jgi:glycosyltransferase involved in cell wall biosynthesis
MDISGISVVIPAYNEEKYLPETLESLSFARRQVGVPVEVIVVDNASTDRTAIVAEQFGARVIRFDVRIISAVRNHGIQQSRYDLIVSIDADCLTPPDALQKIKEFMSDGRHIGGGLGLQIVSKKSVVRIVVPILQFFIERIGGIQGAVFFFLKEDALAIGGFDESRLIAEDSIFSIAMRRHAKLKGKRFGILKQVIIQTVDRKDTSLATLASLAFKLLRVFLGEKLTRKDLAYWYAPRR